MRQRDRLIFDLWGFIENVNEDTPDRTAQFFALRERVRAAQKHHDNAVARSIKLNDRAAQAGVLGMSIRQARREGRI